MGARKKDPPQLSVFQSDTRMPGSLDGKFAVILDGGKTIIFIADRNKEEEIRHKYRMHDKQCLEVTIEEPVYGDDRSAN